MNKKQQKHDLLITFLSHVEEEKRKRPAPVNPKRTQSPSISAVGRLTHIISQCTLYIKRNDFFKNTFLGQ